MNELSVPQLEALFEGYAKNNDFREDGKSSKSDGRLEDSDALRYLLDNGGKI